MDFCKVLMLKFCKEAVPTGWNWLSGCVAGPPVPLHCVPKGGVGKPYCCGGHMGLGKWPREVADAAEMGAEPPRVEVMETHS